MEIEVYAWIGGGVLAAAFLASCCAQVRQYRRLALLDDRLTQLTAGIALLTDTAEGGLRDVAHEIGRIASATPAATTEATTRRNLWDLGVVLHKMATGELPFHGRSVEEIAGAEEMSEGEVRLRLQLIGAPSEEAPRAAVR